MAHYRAPSNCDVCPAYSILTSAEVRDRFHTQGADVLGGTPEDLAATIRADRQRYARMVKDYNIQLD